MKTFATLLLSLVILADGLGSNVFSIEEHPVIKPMPRSELLASQSSVKNFDSFTFTFRKDRKTERVTKKGRHWHLRYQIKGSDGKVDRTISREEIVENYKSATLEKGGTIIAESVYILTFSLPRGDGSETWARLVAGNGNYNLDIIDEKAFKKQLTFGAEEMKRQLDESGRVTIYGINFDIDKASLKLGAEKVLLEMVKLMKRNPLTIEIQGHTDDTGPAEHNLELSERRAGTVKAFLLTYGIESQRMVAKGYGEEKPVAPNDSEENRALNRRVELVTLK